MKIVWVDDEIKMLTASIATLKVMGHSVIPLDSVSKFLNWLREAQEDSIDIIWLDLMMPIDWEDRERIEALGCREGPMYDVETGLVLYTTVRSKFPSIPIIFLTALPSDTRVNKLVNQDSVVRVVHKVGKIRPVLKVAMEMVEKS